MLFCLAVGIVIPPSRLDQPRPIGPEGLGADIHLEAGGIPDAWVCQGGEEAAHHQLIYPPLLLLKLVLLRRSSGINWGMVGGRPLAPGGHHLSLQQLFCLRRELTPGEEAGEGHQIDGRGIDGIVRPGIGYESVDVEPFANPHGIGSGEANSAGGGDEAGGVKGDGRLLHPWLGLDGADDAHRAQAGQDPVHLILIPDPALGMLNAQLALQVGIYLPVGFGDE